VRRLSTQGRPLREWLWKILALQEGRGNLSTLSVVGILGSPLLYLKGSLFHPRRLFEMLVVYVSGIAYLELSWRISASSKM